MSGDTARDFFISYTAINEPWAKWIAVALERAGYTTLVQAFDFRPGSDFVHLMQQATSSTARTIAVLSPTYFSSRFGEAEWRAAFERDPAGEQGLLIPVRVQPCEPQGLLRSRIFIDLVDTDETTARQRLLDGVGSPQPRPTTVQFPGGPQGTVGESKSTRFPGLGPEFSNLSRRNPLFTGRDTVLEQMHADLVAGAASGGVQVQAVHGLGGVGKSALALEYAHRFASDHDLIWWVPAERPTAVSAALARLAARLGVPDLSRQAAMIEPPFDLGVPDMSHQAVMVEALFDRLRRSSRWLLIYDNAESPDQLADLLPPGGNGHVLVTSRWAAWGNHAATQRLSTMPRAQSIEYLRRRTGHGDQVQLDALAELVGDLPLALEEAAAYLEETQVDLQHYVRLVRDRARELFGQSQRGVEDEDRDRQRVATVWSVSLERIAAQAPATESLLNLCAFLAPDVPRGLPTEHPEVLPIELDTVVRDQLRYNRTLAAIGRLSLAAVTPASIELHRLVQVVIQCRLPDRDERAWAERAVCLLRTSYPEDSWATGNWPRCQQLLPHLLTVCEHADRLQLAQEAAGDLLDRAATYLRARGQYRQAKHLAERALSTTEAAVGPNHPDVGTRRGNLGILLGAQGDLVGARGLLERALQITESALGPNHPSVSTRCNSLGRVLRKMGDLPGAHTQFERALQIAETTPGSQHSYVGTCRNNLGGVLQALGDLPGARSQFEQALQITEAGLGPGHPYVGTCRNNLGRVLQELHDLPCAREELQRALQITEAALGPDHPDVGTRRNNLGGVMQALGDLSGARKQFEQALEISEAALGSDHPNIGTFRNNLGRVLQALGDLPGSRTQLQCALEITEAAFGLHHPTVGTLCDNLGSVLQDLGDLAGARAQFVRALQIEQLTPGLNDPRVAMRLRRIAQLCADLGDSTAAAAAFTYAAQVNTIATGGRT